MAHVTSGKMRQLKKKIGTPIFVIALLVAMLALPALGGDEEKDLETLKNATDVFQEMVNRGDIPANILAQADCIMVLPGVKKVGFGVGGSGGRGPMSCRLGDKFDGKWSAPAMYSIGGASLGFQVGATSSDFVILVATQKGVKAVLEDKTKLGADATAAAGPGATAQSNTVGGADVYTYGRAKGLFAGVSLEGATLHPDQDANKRLYGKKTGAREIVRSGSLQPPAGAEGLVSLLNSKVPNHSS
jgi:SH3 domain-containing YSC84-like protein 1